MRLYDVFNSRMAIALGLSVSSMTPPWVGYPLARRVADFVAFRRKSIMVRAVRANQWVMYDETIDGAALDTAVIKVFRSIGRSLYDFYHFLNHPRSITKLVDYDSSFNRVFEDASSGKHGTLIVAPHMSNFDLIARAIAIRGLPMQILSYPQPPGGYRWQNELRSMHGISVTPMSIEAIHKASETLRANKAVITAVDRPLPESDVKYKSSFIGRKAALPVFHIRLALKHDLPITVIGGCRQPDGRYFVWASEPVPLERRPDLVEETVTNAEAVLSVVGKYIRRAPDQWAMLYPVWPETLAAVPA